MGNTTTTQPGSSSISNRRDQRRRWPQGWLSQAAVIGSLLTPGISLAQEPVGRVSPWGSGSADLMLLGADGPIAIGSIANDGMVTLNLPATVRATQPLGLVFGCNNSPEVSIDQPESRWIGTPSGIVVVRRAEQQPLGRLYPSTSARVAESLHDPTQQDTVPGRSYQWIYSASGGRIQGSCTSGSASTSYAVQLQPGWTLIEWQVHSTAIDARGRRRSQHTSMRSLKGLPRDVVWTFLPD